MTNNPNEEWRPLGCCPYHKISNLGRLIGPGRGWKGGVAKPCLVRIIRDNPRWYGNARVHGRKRYIHEMVAVAFIGPRPDGMEINHIDGDKTNSRANNLEYVTHLQNMRHSSVTGLTPRGERSPSAKLTNAQAQEIRESTDRTSELASRYGVTRCQVNDVAAHERWLDGKEETKISEP